MELFWVILELKYSHTNSTESWSLQMWSMEKGILRGNHMWINLKLEMNWLNITSVVCIVQRKKHSVLFYCHAIPLVSIPAFFLITWELCSLTQCPPLSLSSQGNLLAPCPWGLQVFSKTENLDLEPFLWSSNWLFLLNIFLPEVSCFQALLYLVCHLHINVCMLVICIYNLN